MEHEILIESELERDELWAGLLRETISAALAAEGVAVPCEVDVLLTDDEGIHQINLEQRGVDAPTDVLSFPVFDLAPGQLPGPEDADPGTGLVPLLRTYDGADAAMCSMTAGFLTNVVLDALFISVFRWGTAGAAAATVIAQGVSAAGIALYGWRRVPLLRLERRHCKVSRGELGRIMNYSLLTCVQQSVMNFGILMVQGLVNSFGVNVMAAFAAAVKIDAFAYLPVQDFGNAFSTFVAQNTGAQKAERIRKGIRSALWVSVGFCLVSSLLVCLFAAPLMGLFVEPGETEIIAVGVEYLRIEGMCYCGIGILFLLYGLFRGLGRPGVSVVLTVVSLGTRVALAYLLAPIPAVGLKGIWWAVPIGWALADLAGLVLYRRKPLPAETACAPEG